MNEEITQRPPAAAAECNASLAVTLTAAGSGGATIRGLALIPES